MTVEHQESSLGPVRQTGRHERGIFGLRGTDFLADRSTQSRRGRLAPTGVHPNIGNALSADTCRQRIEQVSFPMPGMPWICITSGSSPLGQQPPNARVLRGGRRMFRPRAVPICFPGTSPQVTLSSSVLSAVDTLLTNDALFLGSRSDGAKLRAAVVGLANRNGNQRSPISSCTSAFFQAASNSLRTSSTLAFFF